MVIDGRVYDVSQFALSHPGGSDIIFRVAGTDATQEFLDIHPPEYAWEYVGPALGVIETTASPFSGVLPRAREAHPAPHLLCPLEQGRWNHP